MKTNQINGRPGHGIPASTQASPNALGQKPICRAWLPRVAGCALLGLALALTPAALQAGEGSADKARRAMGVLQSDSSAADKAMACKHLAIYGTPEAVPLLAPLLLDAQLESWARIALEVIPGPAADEALRNALPSVQGPSLVGIINSIGVRGDTRAVPALGGKLNDDNPEVAAAAAIALGRIGGEAALQQLRPALNRTAGPVRSAVAQGCILAAERLMETGKPAEAVQLFDTVRAADVPQQRVLEATRGAILARGDAGLPLLLETLRSPDRSVFGIGLTTARELPGQAVTEALAAELNRLPPDRQSPLLLALSARTDAAVMPAVFAAARGTSKGLRLTAVEILARTRDAAAVPVLLEVVAGVDAESATAARVALLRMSASQVDEALTARLAQTSGPGSRALLELAGLRRVTAAVPMMVRASTAPEASVRAAAIRSLGQTVNADDLGALIGLLASATSEDAMSPIEAALEAACSRIPEKPVAGAKLLAALPNSSVPAQCALLRVLPAASTPEGLATVQAALRGPEPAVRDTALRVLAEWPDAPALPILLGLWRQPADDTQRFFALRGSVRLLGQGAQPTAETLRTYGELLAGSRQVEDRKVILSGLANVADPGALKMLEPLLADEPVRAEAEAAMLTVATGIAGSAPTEAKAVAARLRADSRNVVTRDRASRLIEQMEKLEDFIITWQVSGPYTQPEPGRSIFATVFAPEQPDGQAAWRPLPAGNRADKPGMLDLFAALGGERRAGYVRTWVHSETAQPVRIELGTDDGHKLWLNGRLIAEANRGGAAVPGEFKVATELRAGWNPLLLKVTQDTGPWEFCLRIRQPDGGRLEGLRLQAIPPAD